MSPADFLDAASDWGIDPGVSRHQEGPWTPTAARYDDDTTHDQDGGRV